MTYIGVDGGISGGLVALSSVAGLPPIKKTPMPTKAKKKGSQIDAELVWMWIEPFALQELTVLVEEPCGAKNANAAISMADSFAVIRTILELKGIRRHFVSAKTWQKVMLPGCRSGDTKPFALSVVNRLWPDENWVEAGCRVPNSGTVDAALIAEWARRQLI